MYFVVVHSQVAMFNYVWPSYIIEGKDYEVETSTIQILFSGGKTCTTFNVKINDNDRLESNKSFNVTIDPLSLPYGIVLCTITTAEVVILDDDGTYISLRVTVICDSSAKTSLVRTKISIHFLAQLIVILNSYPHSMSPIARLKWSAFLRGGFTTL